MAEFLIALGSNTSTVPSLQPIVDSQSLDDSLLELLNAGSRNKRDIRTQAAVLIPRLGWGGKPPQTLEKAAKVLGLTRERVRQIEARFLESLPVPLYLPKLDVAIDVLEQAAPLPVHQIGRLLVDNNIYRNPFSAESLINAARVLGHDTDLDIKIVRSKDRFVVASSASVATRSIARVARKLAGMAGVASVFQVSAALHDADKTSSPDEARKILFSLSSIEFLNEDWFWVIDSPAGRNRLSNIVRKILSVTSPQSVSSIREGVRRAYLLRSKSKRGWESLTPPPGEVLAAFFRHSPEFKVDDAQDVSPIRPLNYLTELGEIDRAFVDVLRATPTGVLDRRSMMEACVARGINENSTSIFLTYSPILDHIGIDVWKLRGVQVDPAAVEALREANAVSPSERRLLNFGWTPDGKLWVAASLPYTTSSFVLGVPGSIKRFLCNRKFVAIDQASRSTCGQVSISESGTSYGYTPFFRVTGADPGDDLLAEFDLNSERVELSLVNDLMLESEILGE